MNRFRSLVLAVGTALSLLSFASAQPPTLNGKVVTLSKPAALESAQWISKDGVLLEDAKPFWQHSSDNRTHTLLGGSPGLFVLKFKDGTTATAQVLQYDGVNLTPISPGPPAAAPPTPVSMNLSGATTPSAASVANTAGLNLQGQVKKWVLETAATWGSTGAGRENYIQRFDRTPAATCESIAKIFEETASPLKTDTDLAGAKDSLKARLQTFYESQKKPLRTINPAIEDWQPFLRHLDETLSTKFPAIQLTNVAHAQFVLLEIAEAFRELRAYFLDEQLGTTQALTPAGVNSGYGNTSGAAGASAGACDRCRKRRCRCASLLFGF